MSVSSESFQTKWSSALVVEDQYAVPRCALVCLGANACITGRNEEKTRDMAQDIEKAREGSTVLPLIVDIRNGKDMAAAIERCKAELGSIDFVIAGAAGNFLASMNQLSTNAFKSVIDIDVLGSYNTVEASLPYPLESAAAHQTLPGNAHPNGTGGRIIFVFATLHYTGHPMQTHVMAAKAGVDALSTSVAIEQGPRGITSNVIAPGGVAGTEWLSRLTEKGQDIRNKFIPAGRFGTLEILQMRPSPCLAKPDRTSTGIYWLVDCLYPAQLDLTPTE
ncbi:peroxisomal 2 4-dienoyl-CoA reductase sps19 [Pseudogymnoascus australis]